MREKLSVSGLCTVFLPLPLMAACLLLMTGAGCSDTQGPERPAMIEIISGNDQYSLHGTTLPAPLVVRARTATGSPADDAEIKFSIVQGNCALSSSSVRTNADGLASVLMALSPENGMNVAMAALAVNDDEYVLFTAMSADYYCQEAELDRSITYGTSGYLFLATFKSGKYSSAYETNGGIVLVNPFGQSVTGFREFPTSETSFITVPWDIAFSPRGDLFFSMSADQDKLVKVRNDLSTAEFGILDDLDGAELASNPSGIVAGCDKTGPFIVLCDHSFLRFEDAYYPSRVINNDAFAVNQATEDAYFINTSDSTLYRLPLDSLEAEGPPEEVAYLTADEARGANGMVCDTDGMLYVLVDTQKTKELLKINPSSVPASAKTILYNFFSQGQGSLAGKQRDLAIDTQRHFLYTIDTLNNRLLGYNLIAPGIFGPIFTSEDLSIADINGGERVGLVVLP